MTWKLVPVEATEEMKDATYDAHARAETVFTTAAMVWEAELQAAPAPPDEVLERMAMAFFAKWGEDGTVGSKALIEAMRAALAAAEERSDG